MSTTRPMRADARRNHERLVAAAREAFTEHGVDASLDDIARQAGVGPGTLYRHFPTRETLMEAVYHDDIERLSNRAHQLAASHPPDEALAAWMREQLRYVTERRGLGAALKATLGKDSETFARCKAMMREAAATVLEPAQEAGLIRADVEPRDLLLLGHSLGVAVEAAPEAFDRLLAVTINGLRSTNQE